MQKVCSYHDIVEHLNMTSDGSLYQITRPVLDHTHATLVELDVILVAILSVVGVSEPLKESLTMKTLNSLSLVTRLRKHKLLSLSSGQ